MSNFFIYIGIYKVLSYNTSANIFTMQSPGYSPYQAGSRKKFNLKIPKLSGSLKKWLLIIGGIIVGILLIIYLCLGELRFFANHFLRLTFFSKNYIILLQNNFEMRPTGGFITGYGEFSTIMGIPTDISFHNSYEIDTDEYITPPYPHEELLKNEWYEGYTFRDANWNPHFPNSAETLIEFYNKKFPEKKVDGIIVMNYNLVENLVEKLGSIELEESEFNGDNLFKLITDTVNDVDRHNEEALMHRKQILGELAKELMNKGKWHPFKTKRVIVDALNNKDLFLWFKSDTMQRLIEKKDWANAMVLPENSDFIAVNIANLGSKKADRYILKEVYHHANLTNEIPEITTEIVLRYPGFISTYTDDYKGYLRLYIPGSAEVKEGLFEGGVTKVGDFKVIDTQIILPAGSRTTLKYTYTLPRTLLENNEYRLRIIKQSGDDKRYNVTAESHPDSAIKSDDFEDRENRAYFEGRLISDVDLSLKLLNDVTPPYPIEQVFSDLNTISIYWNEPIDPSTGNDALNYELIDLDYTNESITDAVNVVYAEIVDASVSKLEVEGITNQPLERYKVTLKDLRDSSGNTIEPNPKEITVVQRIKGSETESEE